MMTKKLFPAAAAISAVAFFASTSLAFFDRQVPNPRVVAKSVGEALEKADSVTSLDLHVEQSAESVPFEFPEGLERFPALDFLSVRGRRSLLSVPDSISAAKRLRTLDLADTGISELPESLAGLSYLRSLYLSDCKLQVLPEIVSNLGTLEYLNLDRNELKALPVGIAALPSLKWLRLNGNRIADLPRGGPDGWKSIKKLYLRGNGLKKVPDAVLEMTSLEELDLGENDLRELPEELCRLPNLRRIDVDSNPELTALPQSIGELKSLTHLFAFKCPLSTNEQQRVREIFPDRVRVFMAF